MKSPVNITLSIDELVYDVRNITHLTSRSRDNGENYVAAANIQLDDRAENHNQLLRFINNAFAALKNLLAEYLEQQDNDSDNSTDDSNITFTLQMPANFNQAVTSTITHACHQYIVNMAVADWYTITDKADAAEYYSAAAASIQSLKEALTKRKRPQRP